MTHKPCDACSVCPFVKKSFWHSRINHLFSAESPWQTDETHRKQKKQPTDRTNERKINDFTSLHLLVIVTFLLIMYVVVVVLLCYYYCVAVVPKSKDNSTVVVDDDEKKKKKLKETTTGDKERWRQNVSDSKYLSAITSAATEWAPFNLQRILFFYLSRKRKRARAFRICAHEFGHF